MTISKRAKQRFKIATAAEKKAVAKAAKTLYEFELMGVKRVAEITRWSKKNC